VEMLGGTGESSMAGDRGSGGGNAFDACRIAFAGCLYNKSGSFSMNQVVYFLIFLDATSHGAEHHEAQGRQGSSHAAKEQQPGLAHIAPPSPPAEISAADAPQLNHQQPVDKRKPDFLWVLDVGCAISRRASSDALGDTECQCLFLVCSGSRCRSPVRTYAASPKSNPKQVHLPFRTRPRCVTCVTPDDTCQKTWLGPRNNSARWICSVILGVGYAINVYAFIVRHVFGLSAL
jgi:hypothetical protein